MAGTIASPYNQNDAVAVCQGRRVDTVTWNHTFPCQWGKSEELMRRTAVIRTRGQGIDLRSLRENIDTGSSGGKLIFYIFGSLAEFEHDLIRERTQAGLQAARSRGKVGGRPRKLDNKKPAIAQELYNEKTHSVAEICMSLGISRATLYRYVEAGEGEDLLGS